LPCFDALGFADLAAPELELLAATGCPELAKVSVAKWCLVYSIGN